MNNLAKYLGTPGASILNDPEDTTNVNIYTLIRMFSYDFYFKAISRPDSPKDIV